MPHVLLLLPGCCVLSPVAAARPPVPLGCVRDAHGLLAAAAAAGLNRCLSFEMLYKWISWQQALHTLYVHLMTHLGTALSSLVLRCTGHQWHGAQQRRGLVVLWHPDVRVGLWLHPIQVSAWQTPANMLFVRKVAAIVYKLPAAAAKLSRAGQEGSRGSCGSRLRSELTWPIPLVLQGK